MATSLIVAESEERAALREAVAKLVGKYGHDYFMDKAKRHEEPTELWADLGAAGFLGVHLSEDYGGGGGTMSDLAVVIEEIATQGCPLLMMVISPAICGTIIDAHGSHELKHRWLRGIADGTLKMAFAITEPDAGSNSHEITTTAHPDTRSDGQGGWRIARYALDKAARYANERQVWKTPIGAHQGVAHPLAEAYIGVQLARLMAFRAAELFDEGADAAEASNIAKFAAADACRKALDQAMQTHGGNGLALEYGPRGPVVRGPHAQDRSGQPRDGAQLRGPVQPGSPPLVLVPRSGGGH